MHGHGAENIEGIAHAKGDKENIDSRIQSVLC
jgi:hypothetical protein